MKIFEHYKYLRMNKFYSIFMALKNGFLAVIVLCVYLSARDVIVNRSAEYRMLGVFAFIGFYLSFLAVLPFRMDGQTRRLFRILKFSDADFLFHLLFMESLEISADSVLMALLFRDFEIFMSPIPCFFLILLLYIVTIYVWYKNIMEKSFHIDIRKISGIRLKNGVSRYLYYTYCASENRFAIWLAQILGFAAIAAGVYYKLPFGVIYYVVLWSFVCESVDLAVSDEQNYVLNKLLKKSLYRMKKEKFLHYLVQATTNTVFILLVYFCCCGEQMNASVLPVVLLLFVYCGIMAVCMLDYSYSFYPGIRKAGNALIYGILLFSVPILGFLIGGGLFIKRRIKKYARNS